MIADSNYETARIQVHNFVLFAGAFSLAPVSANRALVRSRRPTTGTQQPWLVGSNYIPKSAINELETAEATFDPAQIDKELGWAEAMGNGTHACLPHDLLWQQDAAASASASTSSLLLLRAITSAHCSCSLIPAGTLCRNWARNMLPSPGCITPDGCRVLARKRSTIPANIRG